MEKYVEGERHKYAERNALLLGEYMRALMNS